VSYTRQKFMSLADYERAAREGWGVDYFASTGCYEICTGGDREAARDSARSMGYNVDDHGRFKIKKEEGSR